MLRRIGFTVVGLVLVGVGLVLCILPGPGLLLVLAGLVVLSQEYEWAARLLGPVRHQAMRAAEGSVQTRWRIAGSLIAGGILLAAGAAWIAVPAVLPFGGVGSGGSLLASGVLLLGLLGYSYQRWRTRPVGSPPTPSMHQY